MALKIVDMSRGERETSQVWGKVPFQWVFTIRTKARMLLLLVLTNKHFCVFLPLSLSLSLSLFDCLINFSMLDHWTLSHPFLILSLSPPSFSLFLYVCHWICHLHSHSFGSFTGWRLSTEHDIKRREREGERETKLTTSFVQTNPASADHHDRSFSRNDHGGPVSR